MKWMECAGAQGKGMTIHVLWDDEAKTIIRSESEGNWTWEEYHESLSQIVQMVQSVNHRVDLIHRRLPGSVRPPSSGMAHYQRAMRILPENTGLNVVINTNTIARSVANIFTRLYGRRTRGAIVLVGSLEEAYKLIAADRAKVNDKVPA
jgi:hypothetical protein